MPKIKVKSQTVQTGERPHTNGHTYTRTHTDATKRIISPATRSIITTTTTTTQFAVAVTNHGALGSDEMRSVEMGDTIARRISPCGPKKARATSQPGLSHENLSLKSIVSFCRSFSKCCTLGSPVTPSSNNRAQVYHLIISSLPANSCAAQLFAGSDKIIRYRMFIMYSKADNLPHCIP